MKVSFIAEIDSLKLLTLYAGDCTIWSEIFVK